MRIRPFLPLCPPANLAARVSAPPYDVLSREEAWQLAKDEPLSLLHVTRAEIDFDHSVHPYEEVVYTRALENFTRLKEQKALIPGRQPSLFVYEQSIPGHVQRGIAATVAVEEYDAGLIKKHEKTRQDKEDDRTRLTRELRANAGPVFLTYRDSAAVNRLVDQVVREMPWVDFVARDTGVRHRAWQILETRPFVEAFAQVPCAYIADGHHRAASAARVGRELREANPRHNGQEDYNWFLAVLFPASQLKILPYHRLVTDLGGRSPQEWLAVLAEHCGQTPQPTGVAVPTATGQICFYLAGQWYDLILPAPLRDDPVSRLDVAILQERILAPLLGIDDPRTSQRIDFVGGIRGPGYLQNAVDSGRFAIAFSLAPVTIDQLMDIADAGQIMPPKSTWFEPKLRSGLFLHTF